MHAWECNGHDELGVGYGQEKCPNFYCETHLYFILLLITLEYIFLYMQQESTGHSGNILSHTNPCGCLKQDVLISVVLFLLHCHF